MKLLRLLKNRPFCNDFHFIFIAILLFILGIKYYIILIFLFSYLVFIYKKTKLIIPISIILIVLSLIIGTKLIIKDNYKKDNYHGIVTNVSDNNYILKTSLVNIKVYEYNHKYIPGDIIDLDIYLIDNKKSYDNDFDNEEYLLSKNISFIGNAKKSNKTSFIPRLETLKYYYLKYLNNNLSSESYNYVSSVIFTDNIMDKDIKDSYSALGISHILAISGMHIILIFNILSFILFKLFKIYHKLIPLTIITIYVLLIGMPTSALRALLFLILKSLNDNKKVRYTNLDILSISGVIMLIYNPYMLYSLSFILSFLVSFVLIFDNDLFKTKSFLVKNYFRYFIIFLITLPFTIKINNKISLLSILLSPVLSLVISYLIIPLSFILGIFPILDYFIKYLFIFINYYLNTLSLYSINIHIKTFSIYLLIIYYFLFSIFILSIAKKKYTNLSFSFITLFIAIIISFKYLNFIPDVTFIDVGQGDSALIRLPNSSGVILIDSYNSFEFLKTEGINKIDYLVLTHSDSDHTGDFEKIVDYFKVDKILYPYYDTKFDEMLINYDNKIKVDYNYQIKIADFKFDIIGPIKKYDDPNSNSIVIKATIYDYTFLFTGDMTMIEEADLVNVYGTYLDSDILKVGHHGSNTSTSQSFLDLVSPTYSVISVGENNKYGHPDKYVYERLIAKSKVYMTKDSGNITFRIINHKLNISTYR